MKQTNTAIVTAMLLTTSAAGVPVAAYAQDYPSKTITMIVPFPAGGSTDVLGRILAQHMTTSLKQQVIVENVGGAGGTIGVARVARAEPDGHTILFHNMAHASAPSLYSKLSYDPQTSFEPIGSVADVPMILVARKDFKPSNFSELTAHVKANPGTVTFANAGVGATSHLCALVLNNVAQLNTQLVPYKGTGPALNDLVGGHVDMICDQPASTTGFINKGDIKAIAVATKDRLPTLKNVPTFAESGLKDFELSVWHGLYAPKGTPETAVVKISQALQSALKEPTVVQKFAELGAQVPPTNMVTPEGLRAHLKSEVQRLGEVIRKAGVAPQ